MAKILVVEDNNEINQMIADLLSENDHVIQAYSGTEGLLLFQQESPDLVLLDIMLPGKNGDQVLSEIRKVSQVPVIMLTALGEKKLVSDYLLNGANDYITKPFDDDELFARVMVQLRHFRQEYKADGLQSVKNIIVDMSNFEIFREGERVRLGKKEFEILTYLLEHPNQIFTKEQLYEAIWKESYLRGDNSLNAQLSNLRKKIGVLDSEEEYIETIWGLGVRLAGDKK
ncbi:response regulator transcription factor [Oceanobacillus jeddahense]|uniref:Response regulator transcription factor n=1 Tax=Oceanobacillus jeddahense TaxID=1462527 RepID=A0ABY5JX47_9BACI|nr:response regulator transcription factor [Oceanobacillus jeddahense]UUI03144.1 response regulator transcription factor [Oceanobacillus jeddahense]